MLFSMLVKAELRLVPIAVHAAMQTTAIRAAMSPYSIAVTPVSSLRRFTTSARTLASVTVGVPQNGRGILKKALSCRQAQGFCTATATISRTDLP